MKTVWKYPLQVDDYQQVSLPEGAELLCVKLQKGTPCLWALVDPSIPTRTVHTIRCAGTGHSIAPEYNKYLGTILIMNDDLVFHFFAREEE